MCRTNRTLRLCSGLMILTLVLPHEAAAQAPAPPPTLWKFLGIPQGFTKLNAQIFNRRGNTPRLEKKPPLKPIADASNLAADMPKPIQAAAKIKIAEDMAPQKIKAIKYLAEIGCGCYDKQGEVTEALVAAMDDCTERVRLEAVQAIMTAASELPCWCCGSKCCCNEAILKKLAELAYERGPDGCHLEPSERVREAAAEALTVCCSTQEPIEVLEEDTEEQPIERPEEAAMEGVFDGPPMPPSHLDGSVAALGATQFALSSFIDAQQESRHPSGAFTASPSSPRMTPEVVSQNLAKVIPRRGEVTYVDVQDATARVRFDAMGEVPPNTTVRAYHTFLFGTANIGTYVVIAWNEGEAIIRKADGGGIGKLARGDKIIVK